MSGRVKGLNLTSQLERRLRTVTALRVIALSLTVGVNEQVQVTGDATQKTALSTAVYVNACAC